MTNLRETQETINSLARVFLWGLIGIAVASVLANYLIPLVHLFKIILCALTLLSSAVVYSLYHIALHSTRLASQEKRERERLTNMIYDSSTHI